MPKQFGSETKRRAVRLVEEYISANACSIEAECSAVSPKIDISYHMLRNWLKGSRGSHQSSGEMSREEIASEVAQLRSRLREMEREPTIASKPHRLFRQEAHPPRPAMICFIKEQGSFRGLAHLPDTQGALRRRFHLLRGLSVCPVASSLCRFDQR